MEKRRITTQQRPRQTTPKSSFGVQDVLYILFKHKWKILIPTLLGFVGASTVFYLAMKSPKFESQAQLIVRYVIQRGDEFETRMNPAGRDGGAVMGTELAILQGANLALKVAEKIGPERLLPDAEETPTLGAAAASIHNNLEVMASRGSNIINLVYRSPDPELTMEVLNEFIAGYGAEHLRIHRNPEAFDEVARTTDQIRSRLVQTEDELSKLKVKAGVFSVTESMAAAEVRRNLVNENLLVTGAALAGQRTKVASLEEALGVPKAIAVDDDKEDSSEQDPVALAEEDSVASMDRTVAISRYRDLNSELSTLKASRIQRSMTKTSNDPGLVFLKRKIESLESERLALLRAHPELVNQEVALKGGNPEILQTGPNLDQERAFLAELTAKYQELEKEVVRTAEELLRLSLVGNEISALERRRQLEEEQYQHSETSLGKAKVDAALDPNSMPNIGIIESPTTPRKAVDPTTKKIAMGLGASGLMAGLALAFLIELVVDRRVSRATEIQTRLQLPLMMSIPWIRSKDSVAKLVGRQPGLEVLGDAGDVILPPIPQSGNAQLSEHGEEHFISPYAAAIRDRIMFNFELNNITHKPKLVAVTGLSKGAGTSTVAAGIAKAFSEHENKKILLVDLNPAEKGIPMHRRPEDSLMRAVELSRAPLFRESPRRLYYASAPTKRDSRSALSLAPAALFDMMPSLTESDYDYVIFDLPPVDSTSPTLSMAGFMDKVLLVVDGEKTSREMLSWGYSELERGRADVSCIFNKARSHAPSWVAEAV